MTTRVVLAVLLAMLLTKAAPALEPGRDEETTFDRYTDLSSNAELARRLLTPLTAQQVAQRVSASGKDLRDQPIDLSAERFRVYLPKTKPAAGYGVFVFVSPFQGDGIPRGWADVLDAHGMIFVSAAHSGNVESPLGRREPLAILAAFNVMQRYPIDPRRVVIAGLSGGSRIAMRLALGYPDLFHAAVLDAGSDPVGSLEIPIPPRALFEQFRSESKLVYVTGSHDDEHLRQEADSKTSLHHWCMERLISQTVVGIGHVIAPASALERALAALAEPMDAQPDQACVERIDRDLDAELSAAKTAADSARLDDARDRLRRIDLKYGGLAAPQTTDLMRRIESGRAASR